MTSPAPVQAVLRDERRLLPAIWAFWLSAALLVIGLVLTTFGSSAGDQLLRAGLMALMATPLLRVLGLLALHARRRDWGTVASMIAVLCVMALTLIVATR